MQIKLIDNINFYRIEDYKELKHKGEPYRRKIPNSFLRESLLFFEHKNFFPLFQARNTKWYKPFTQLEFQY